MFFRISTAEEKDLFLENLALLLEAGVSLSVSLEAVSSQLRSPQMRREAGKIAEELNSGLSLSRALEKTKLFPRRIISLIKVGEDSGRLSENLKLIVSQNQKEKIFRDRIQTAMAYPILVFSITAVVGIAVAWFLLPRLATVFNSLQVELPVITKMLISLGDFLQDYGSVIIPTAAILILGMIVAFRQSGIAREWGLAILLRVPGVRRLVYELELARFGYILGSLLQAGLPITAALQSLPETALLPSFRRFYHYLAQSVSEGNSFKKSYAFYSGVDRLFPLTVRQIIAAAESSGSLPETLLKVSRVYEEKTENTAKNLTVILEPILLVLVWLGVAAVAIAVILPIYSLIGGFNP